MKKIFHIVVGDDKYTPTGEELDAIADSFIKDRVFSHRSALVHMIELDSNDKLMLEIGNSNWIPTEAERNMLKEGFLHAMKEKTDYSVVATCTGVGIYAVSTKSN